MLYPLGLDPRGLGLVRPNNATLTKGDTMQHDKDCSAVIPCESCSQKIRNARIARNAYAQAFAILEDLAGMPWLIKDANRDNTTKDFNRVYDALRDLHNEADRLIPQPYYN